MTDPVHTSFLAGFFRRRGGLLLLLPVFLSLSRCGTAPDDAGTPPVWDGSPPAWELNPPVQEVPGDPPPGIAGLGAEEREIPDEISAPILPPEAPEPAEAGEFAAAEAAALPPELFRDMEEDWELPEASPLELAESVEEPRPPPEPPLAALPEPLAPIFADPVPVPESPETGGDEPEIVPESPEPVQREAEPLPAIQEDQEVPAQSPEQAAPPPPVPPLPPPYIRPAEEYEAPPVREAPAPSRIPDPPARREEIPEPRIVYSRVVRAVVGQLVEVPFQGTGWVYLGELGSRPGIVYGSRRLDPEGQSFIFRTEAPGTYGLRFYKQDFIRDYILNDFVQVVVGEPPEAAALGWFNPAVDRGRAVAEPRWPSPGGEDGAPGGNSGAGIRGAEDSRTGRGVLDAVLPERIEAAAPSTGSPAATDPPPDGGEAPEGGVAADRESDPAPAEGAPQPAAAVQRPERDTGPEDPGPGDYPERARREFEAGRVAAAIALLDQFRERYPSGSDEAWWLYGQFYEANSPSRDIRSALDYYRRLVREYPQSPRYNDARRRIAYLERYYINIR